VPPLPALVATTLANFGISAVYAGIGSFAGDATTFLFAFLASIIIPAGVLAAAHFARRGFAGAR
jgi:purine-cytosine permease-like protein